VLSTYNFREVIPECVRLDRRGRFAVSKDGVSRGAALTVEEHAKNLETHDYQPFPGILILEDQVVVRQASGHSTDGSKRSGR